MSAGLFSTKQVLLQPLLCCTRGHVLIRRPSRCCGAMPTGKQASMPVLLFDVMVRALPLLHTARKQYKYIQRMARLNLQVHTVMQDTIVKDPFYEHMPPHFGMTFKELLGAKHPTTWLEFERGDISEDEALSRFWADGSAVDGAALRSMLVEKYEYLPGMQELLALLKQQGYEMHVVSNYPSWHQMIEDKLQLSQYLPWTFISCEGPMKGLRKPDAKVYSIVTDHLNIAADEAVFVDDRQSNVDAAKEAGMRGVHMTDAEDLAHALRAIGIHL